MAWYLLLRLPRCSAAFRGKSHEWNVGAIHRLSVIHRRKDHPTLHCFEPSKFRTNKGDITWLKVGSWWSCPVHLTTSFGFLLRKSRTCMHENRAPECLIGGLWWFVLIRISWEFQTIYRPKPLIDLICPAGKYEALKSTSYLQNVPLHQPLVLPPIFFSIFDPYSIHQSSE